jgi:multiple sugar transport system ATP-binding protein
MATVTFDKAQRWYPGNDKPTVPALDLEIADGEFMVLVGPSGCGKSTSLRMLAGLEEINDGKIFIGDRDVTNVPPKDRDIAMVFQNYALYPHMTVADNMAFALKMAKVPSEERGKRVQEAAKILGLTEFLERKPKALSGGQRQRVAMGRAIVRNPQVFCMDEPLSNLDAKMRVQTRTDIAKLQSDLGVTTVYVTHDQVEAMTMGDRVAVMNLGELMQVDTPLNLYDKPVNLFVAGFIGSPQMNLIQARAGKDGNAQIGNYAVPVDPAASQQLGAGHTNITQGVRPEAWRLVSANEGGLPIQVTVVEELGADGFVYGNSDVEGTPSNVIVRVSARDSVSKGDTIYVTTDPSSVHVFDTDSGERLSA